MPGKRGKARPGGIIGGLGTAICPGKTNKQQIAYPEWLAAIELNIASINRPGPEYPAAVSE